MPAEYEAIRDSLVKRGKNYDEAQRIAAATYNKRHPGHPMSNKHHSEDTKPRHRMPPPRKS